MIYLSGPCKTKAVSGGYQWTVQPVTDGTQRLPKVRIDAKLANGEGRVTVKKDGQVVAAGDMSGTITGKGCNCDVDWDNGDFGSFGATPTGLSGNVECPSF